LSGFTTLENIFSIAEWIPGIDNIASIGSAVTNVIQGDWGEAGLDLLGVLPFVNEAKHGVKVVDAAIDVGKGVKKAGKAFGLIDDVVALGKATSETAGKIENVIDIVKPVDKIDDAYNSMKIAGGIDDVVDIGKAAERIDDAHDFGKIANKIDDTYDAAKAAKESADMARKRLPQEVMNPSKPITSVTDNYELAKAYQSPNGNGMFGIKGKNSRIYKSSDQYESAADFYARISRGGKETVFGGNKGLMSKFDDGSRVMYRVITSTADSPAVEIKMLSNGKVQKIHFILEELKWLN